MSGPSLGTPRGLGRGLRMAVATVGLAMMLWGTLACGGASPGAEGPDQANALLLIRAKQRKASIWVDGHFVAEIAQAGGGILLEPGDRRVEIRSDGFHTYYQIVHLDAGEHRELDVHLAPELP